MRVRNALLPALLVAVVYLPALGSGFVWIDWSEIVDGVMIVPVDRLGEAFLTSESASGYHRPVYRLIHTIDWWIWGANPLGYHLSSLLLHALNTILVAALLGRWCFPPLAAAACALLWGLHPVNSATVGLVHAKADLAVTACLLGTLLAFQHRRWLLTGCLAAMALLTKETAFLLPVAVTIFFLARRRAASASERRDLARLQAIAWTAATLAGLLHVLATGAQPARAPAAGILERMATFVPVYLDYLKLLLLPLELRMSDTVTRFSHLPLTARLGSLLVFLLVVAVQIRVARRHPRLARWILLLHLTLLPVAQLVPTLHFRADRYLYLPSLAFVALGVDAALPYLTPLRHWRIAVTIASVTAGLWATRVVLRLQDQRDDFALFEAEVARIPDYKEGLSVLARAHERRGDFARAAALYRRCLEPAPGRLSYYNRGVVLVNLTNALLRLGEDAEARALGRAHADEIRLPEVRRELRFNAAVASFNLGRFDEVVESLPDYLRSHPGDATGLWLLGFSAARTGHLPVARGCLRRFLLLAGPDTPKVRQARSLLEEVERALDAAK